MRLASRLSRTAIAAASVLAAVTCTDVLTTPGVANISLVYTGDTLIVVGGAGRAAATATANGKALAKPRFALLSSDTTVVAVRGTDSLVGKKRGVAALSVALASNLLPSNPPAITRTLRVVVDTLRLDSASVTLTSLGDTVRLTATATDANGDALSGIAPAWSSSDTTVVSVTSAGRLLAKANGPATVRAVVDFDTASAPVTVRQVLAHFTFAPTTLVLDALTATGQVTTTPRDARTNPMTVPTPSFSSGNTAIATVNAAGTARAVVNGSTYIYVTSGTVTDSFAVVVDQHATLITISPSTVPPITSIGDQVQLAASATDRNGFEVQDGVPVWVSLDPTIARVNSEGLVTGLSAGTGRVAATLDGAAGQVNVPVANQVSTVEVSPDTATATSIGDTLVFTSTVRNGRGDLITAATVGWATPDGAVLTVLADGRAIAKTTGTGRVIASSGGKADTGIARVTNQPAVVSIAPDARSLTALGVVDTPQVTFQNARGATLPRNSVTWTSDDNAIARVNALGIITAVDTGQTYVRATSGSLTDSVLAVVTNVPVSISVTIAGRPIQVSTDTLTALGQSLRLSVNVRNRLNNVIANYPVAWSSRNPTVVDTVRNDTAIAIGFGSVLLIAQAGTAADSVTIVVKNLTRLFVDNSVVLTPKVGTGTRPYAKIQDAVNAADANDTVFIRNSGTSYSETVALTRRLTILGDSAGFVSTGRNPSALPLLAHDTGSAGIIAHTTAPMTIRYLAVSHTLDGPALDADGSDVVLEWFYVNRQGSVQSNIGRGISIANSPSGTRITNTSVSSVREYGIRLSSVSSAQVMGDSVFAVDSLSTGGGSGIQVSGGSSNAVLQNSVRQTQGPMILVRNASLTNLTANLISGRQQLIRVVNAPGTSIGGHTFSFDSQNCTGSSFDGRSGVEIDSTTLVTLSSNSFTETAGICGGASMDAVRLIDARNVQMNGNRVHNGRYAVRSIRSSWSLQGTRADSTYAIASLEQADTLTLTNDTIVSTRGQACIYTRAASLSVAINTSLFDDCRGSLGYVLDIVSTGSQLTFNQSRVNAALGYGAVSFNGVRFLAQNSIFAGTGDSTTTRIGVNAGVAVLADTAVILGTTVADFAAYEGLRYAQATNYSLNVQSSRVTRNRLGIHFQNCLPDFTGTSGTNDIYDNSHGGMQYDCGGTLTLPDAFWWGDSRGPRRAADPAATGDSLIAPAGSFSFASKASPGASGATAVALRIVRGNGQTGAAGNALAKAFTVRAVDVNGKPATGVTVVFTVTGGGGSFSGMNSFQPPPNNASGLVEATLTLGSSPGTNTVRVSTSGGIPDVIFTATGT